MPDKILEMLEEDKELIQAHATEFEQKIIVLHDNYKMKKSKERII